MSESGRHTPRAPRACAWPAVPVTQYRGRPVRQIHKPKRRGGVLGYSPKNFDKKTDWPLSRH